ncbi:MAG: SpoIID/LytB domain-containing protein [Phycisphaerales bacterium]
MSTTIQLATTPVKIPMQMFSGRRYSSTSSIKLIALLILLVIPIGCKRRQVIKPTSQMDIEPQFWVRVLLFNNIEACTLKINSSFSITDDPNQQTQLPTAQYGQIDEPISIQLTNGGITIGGRSFLNEEITIFPDGLHIFNLNGNYYRGKLKFIINSDDNSFDAINLVPPEAYLAGVVGAEMPNYWEPEALKAQAIAARTYCFHIKRQFGEGREWDMRKTAAHQVYRGVSAESNHVWEAITQTAGQVLVCNQADGVEDIFPSYYSAVCGGHTENSKNVFGDSFETLIGVPCSYCKDVAKSKFFFWPTIQFDKADVITKLLQRYPSLKQLGEITDITIDSQSDYPEFSRITKISLSGSNGKSDFLRAEDFRLAIDPTGRKVKSAIYKFTTQDDKWSFTAGRGWGHGVGMCQCGAQGMARKGKDAEQILSYYYPGSKITKLY